MQERVKVVVDAMGGDNAPAEIVKGAVEAVNERKDIKVFLTGRKPVVDAQLQNYTYDKDQIEAVSYTHLTLPTRCSV